MQRGFRRAVFHPLQELLHRARSALRIDLQRLRERGIRVPEDAAISAFSGTSLAEVVYPTLSTVDSPTLEMGRVAARQLLDQLGALAAGEPLPEPRTIVLNAEINVRDSI